MNGLCVCVTLFLWSCTSYAGATTDNPTFMMVSGISASEEMCLTAANGAGDMEGTEAALQHCTAAIAAGDGRELWQRLPNGQITTASGTKCVGAVGDAVILTGCDGGDSWATQANGQLKYSRAGDYCLSQKGSAAGMDDAAADGAVTASSTADAGAHGANRAVDGSSSTFWASALDPAGPVTITVDLGSSKRLSTVGIQWEFPAKSFTVGVSGDGIKWSEVYATDSNVLSSSTIALGSVSATRVRVVMHEAAGSFHGRAVYGIKAFSAYAPRLHSVLEDCAAAARSSDARDKYFITYVGEHGPCSSKALRSELPSLEAARAAVAAVVSELAEALPKMSSCHGAVGFVKGTSGTAARARLRQADDVAQTARIVDSQNGVETDAVAALLKEARRVIIAARGALF